MKAAEVALFTAGRDKPYALGLASALIEKGIPFEFLGSDAIDAPILHSNSGVIFRNMRGDQATDRSLVIKIIRVLTYYGRLISYSVGARPKIFHILWNNKFEYVDRTLLMLFYALCGRRIVFTAHNVNAGKRDGYDSFLNRLTLKIQYGLSHHIFVHTEEMRQALQSEFQVPAGKCSVIPFGMNSTVPNTPMESRAARAKLGLDVSERVLLFFGNIAPYKGLEYLVEAMAALPKDGRQYRLLIAGRVKEADAYWQGIQATIERLALRANVLPRIEYIPDEETEIYFKAADVLVLPYKHIFQSGVLFLGYNFGLPVIASDVGSLRDDIVEGKTGFMSRSEDPDSIAQAIERYFASDLYRDLQNQRQQIKAFASQRYSWSRVAEITGGVYAHLLNPEQALDSRIDLI